MCSFGCFSLHVRWGLFSTKYSLLFLCDFFEYFITVQHLKMIFSCIFCCILLRDVSDIVFRSWFMQLPKMNPSLCISSSMMVPEPWGRMWGTGVSFVAGYREVTYFLHSDPLCISAQLWLTLHPHPMTKSGNIQHKVPRGSWVAIPHGGAILQLMASWAGRANCFGECGSW